MLRVAPEAAMSRHTDIVLVSLFIAATASLMIMTQSKRADAPAAPPADTGPTSETFAATVATLLPELQGHVASGSTKTRDGSAACVWDSRTRSARVDSIERDVLGGAEYRNWTDPETRSLAEPLHDAIAPLRECVSCSPVKSGCADAARALVTLERRLGARKATSVERGGI
jgi:hypothetical protein